jgi:DNA modification methylase
MWRRVRKMGLPVTEPYFTSDSTVIYHGDCRDHLDHLGQFDLIVTDPPYGVDYQSNRRDDHPQFDKIDGDLVGDDALWAKVIADAVRVNLRRYRHTYVFGPLDLSGLVEAGLTQEPIELVWDKSMVGMGDLTLPWGPAHEPIQFLVGVKSKANVKKGEGRLAARLRQGSVLRHQRANSAGATRHPNEKPVPLLRGLIESSSCIGESVFDPFMGSGSTLVAAVLEGRTAVGVELDERYCALAAKRITAVEKALRELGAA